MAPNPEYINRYPQLPGGLAPVHRYRARPASTWRSSSASLLVSRLDVWPRPATQPDGGPPGQPNSVLHLTAHDLSIVPHISDWAYVDTWVADG